MEGAGDREEEEEEAEEVGLFAEDLPDGEAAAIVLVAPGLAYGVSVSSPLMLLSRISANLGKSYQVGPAIRNKSKVTSNTAGKGAGRRGLEEPAEW